MKVECDSSGIGRLIADVHRREWATVLAATMRVTRDLDLAEECVQDAFARAMETWPERGVPERPGAWLTTVAANRARDLLRRESAFRRTLPLLVMDETLPGPGDELASSGEADDRLRLIFICCHPALSREAQVALTLRLVCGLTTTEVARAFLVQESTMAARITRAKKKIAVARIPFRMPPVSDLPGRVGVVCDVLHLVFTVGHTDPKGKRLIRTDLVETAIRLARMLHQLLPDAGEVGELLALMLLVDARRGSRESETGELVLLSEQDRSMWDVSRIGEGIELLTQSLQWFPAGRYGVQAAIAAVHAEAQDWESTDWEQIVELYTVLWHMWPSPVVALNRAIAVGFQHGPDAGLEAMAPLLEDPALATYGYLRAAQADFLRQLERWKEALDAYRAALELTTNGVERRFLTGRLEEMRIELP